MASSSTHTSSSSPSFYNELTLHELYTIYHIECTGNSEQTLQKIFEFFNLQETEANTRFLLNKIDYFTSKKKAKYSEWKKQHTADPHRFSATALNRNEFPDQKIAQENKPKPPKRPTKDFAEVGTRQKRRKLVDLNSELDDFAAENNITVNQVLGYLLHQRNYSTNKYLAKLGEEMYKSGNISEDARSNLDLDHTLALKVNINLSRNDTDFLKSYLSDSIHIPNRNLVREHAQSLVPALKDCREGRGILVESVSATITLTVTRLIDQLLRDKIHLSTDLLFRQKTGHDGAGGQSLYRSNNNPMTDPNIFSKMMVPLSLSRITTPVKLYGEIRLPTVPFGRGLWLS